MGCLGLEEHMSATLHQSQVTLLVKYHNYCFNDEVLHIFKWITNLYNKMASLFTTPMRHTRFERDCYLLRRVTHDIFVYQIL